MQAVGNVITIFGILVTLVAYFGQHSVSLSELEPGLVRRWNQGRGWVRQKLGRSRTINIEVNSTLSAISSIIGSGMVWSPVQPDDDLETRVKKLERNLDSLRSNADELRQIDQKRFREVTDGLTERVTDIQSQVTTWQDQAKNETTWAMRWEVRGLLIALVGAGLSLFG